MSTAKKRKTKATPKAKPGAKRKVTRKERDKLARARAAKAKKRALAEIAAEAERESKRPLEEKLEELAKDGVSLDDIVAVFQLQPKMADQGFREQVERIVEAGHAHLRISLSKKLASEASEGKITALRDMAGAWLSKFKDEIDLEFASGYEERVVALIDKARERLKAKKAGEL